MKILGHSLVAVFVLFAAFQLNDPDPVAWVGAYLYAAYASLLFAQGRHNPTLYWVGAYAFLLGAIQFFPPSISEWIGQEQQAKSLEMKLPFVEEARESMGLFICFLACAAFWLVSRGRMANRTQVNEVG